MLTDSEASSMGGAASTDLTDERAHFHRCLICLMETIGLKQKGQLEQPINCTASRFGHEIHLQLLMNRLKSLLF